MVFGSQFNYMGLDLREDSADKVLEGKGKSVEIKVEIEFHILCCPWTILEVFSADCKEFPVDLRLLP